MSSGSNIRAVGPDTAPEAQPSHLDAMAEEPFALEDEWVDDWEETAPAPRDKGWIMPVAAGVIIACWTAFYGWANRSEMLGGGSAQQWTAWIAAWAVPVLLVVCMWILASRNSSREAVRFGQVARLLSDESAALENRLSVVNRELSLAREFLAAQSRELESLGRIAAERLSHHADHLQSLIQSNGEQVDRIADVSTSAVENMVRLRDDLPVVANSARDVTNQIGGAGRTANAQIEEMINGFGRLNDFGQASARQVIALQGRIDAALAGFEVQTGQMETIASTRFETLRARSEDFRAELDGREVEALAAMRRRADTLAAELATARDALDNQEEEAIVSLRARITSIKDETGVVGRSVRESENLAIAAWAGQIDAMQARLAEAIATVTSIDEAALAASNRKLQDLKDEAERVDAIMTDRSSALGHQLDMRRSQMAQDEHEATAALALQLAELDAAIAARRAEQIEHTNKLAEHGEAIAQRMWDLRSDLESLAQQGSDTQSLLGQSAADLAGQLKQGRDSVDGTANAIRTLTEETVRLLELIQASAVHSRKDLPGAISEATSLLSTTEERVNSLHVLLSEAGRKGEELSEYVLAAQDTGNQAIRQADAFHERLSHANASHLDEIERLQTSLAALGENSEALSHRAQAELSDAIAKLETAARDAVAGIETGSAAKITALAQNIGSQTAEAIENAVKARTVVAVAELETAAANASGASREATIQLRDQLGKVNELASNLESRVARARERAEEQVDNDFSRRVALITESLNSNAIDISKALSNDVTDTAWAAYLRGDRGIFTRRAVRLLDNTQARDIAEIYAADSEFSANVSRYIHDFEAMLRTMLSTRDGNALGVTVLSSDMGKLYVALAQAIERLRN
ncbi:ATPase [Altererythrobacter confluentis]|uniref:ATPase n=1 Tax=Allopontixanthobacter confluentis TaxID=1849021 RepID=A0A6L7GF00_9SPHN|nr:ATPase [Allopontixanthobacter confluentis]MXP14210.1 ATPase [Allopontixanthobacter confluentis]